MDRSQAIAPSRFGGRAAAPRIIYLVTEDWYFISHRLPMARAVRAAGFDIHVATRVDRHGAAIVAEGFELHPVSWQRGSLEALRPLPEPGGPVTIAFVGRLVASKGIRALVETHAQLVASGQEIRLLIAGVPDPANPAAIGADEIERWRRQTNVSYLGFVEDIAALWACAHIAVLPSHREGLPLKSAGGRGLRPAAHCNRRAGLSRYRASQSQRVVGPARRCGSARPSH
jgi:glycosyltransferase involved in cell wall biosynthesis